MCTYIQIVKEQKQMILPSQPKTRCLKTPCIVSGGGERVRTDDLLRARQALSQLSYTPEKTRTELLQSRWWAWMELNHRPHAYQACALTKLSYRPFVRARAHANIGR